MSSLNSAELFSRSLNERSGPTILVVDDEAVIRELCAKVLKGYRVLEAENGEEALDLLDREDVDIVLTDVMMPQMNGLDLLKEAKARNPNQAVVVMTGFAEKDIILRALKSDADDFISKPINLLQLKTTIDKVLEKKVLKEELVHIKSMDRLKADFLGLISHKLKTPTTAISLFIQNLSRGVADPSDPAFQEALVLIQKESDYLGYLIQDLLTYSEIILQEGPPKLEPVSLSDLLQTVGKEQMLAAAEKGVALSWDPGLPLPEMSLDRRRIYFVLQSLLDNAIKFTPPGGSVTVTADRTDTRIELQIQDTGPGIPPAELPKIFEKFFQVDPAKSGQVRGFGLGLFYSRQFVKNHGGSLRVESESGKGTRFLMALPIERIAAGSE